MTSIAEAQDWSADMVWIGLRRRARTVAPLNWSGFSCLVTIGEEVSGGGVGGSKSIAASQSSSTNLERYERMESGRMTTTTSSLVNVWSRAAATRAAMAEPEEPPTSKPSSAIKRRA